MSSTKKFIVKKKTLGVPFSSMALAFKSTMPVSRLPSFRAFWIRRSKIFKNNSNNLLVQNILAYCTLSKKYKNQIINSDNTNLFWVSGGSPKSLLRNRPTSCISESVIRPNNLLESSSSPLNIRSQHLLARKYARNVVSQTISTVNDQEC